MRVRRGIGLMGLSMALVLVASACQQAEESGQPTTQQGGVFKVQSQEPGSLDPPVASGSEDVRVVHTLFKGLVQYNNKTSAVEPAVATAWDVSPDATKFTFHLRKDSKFTNGEQVTADSFVRGWTRSLTPELYDNPDGLGYHLDGIKGAADLSSGKTKTLAGVRAVDQYTFEVTLAEPDAEFLVKVGHNPFLPIPSDAAMAAQKPSWAENPIGNGPFKMKEAWIHNQRITVVANDDYFGKKPSIDQVDFIILPNLDTAYLEWQAGNLDWTRIDPSKFDEGRKQYPNQFIVREMAGINYLSSTTKKSPVDNKLFRQAVSMAIDRKAIADAVFFGVATPAAGIIPPLIPGSRAKGADGPCKYCKYDPAMAKQLFQQSGVKIEGEFPMFFNPGAGHDAWMQAVADQVSKNLGINAKAVAATAQFTGGGGYTGWLQKTAPASINRLGWGLDYPTPDNFTYPLLFSTSTDNKQNYSNPAYDDLIKKARAETDLAKRHKLYQQAEDIALEDMALIPMWWRTQLRLLKLDKWTGLDMDPYENPTVETVALKSAAKASK